MSTRLDPPTACVRILKNRGGAGKWGFGGSLESVSAVHSYVLMMPKLLCAAVSFALCGLAAADYEHPMGEPEIEDGLVEAQHLEPASLEATPAPLPPTPPRDPNDPFYTAFHFQPLKNWMNDPNGEI